MEITNSQSAHRMSTAAVDGVVSGKCLSPLRTLLGEVRCSTPVTMDTSNRNGSGMESGVKVDKLEHVKKRDCSCYLK